MNFWKRYPGDYAKKTAHLSLAAHGAYTLLLDAYYSHGESLENSRGTLHRICRATGTADKRVVDAVVKEFFSVFGGRLFNKRADEEIKKYIPAIEAAITNGKKGGRPKKTQLVIKQEPSGLSGDNPTGTQRGTQSITQDESSSDKSLTTTALRRPLAVVPGVSSLVWDSYEAAYEKRYRAKPVRNAKVNAQLKQFVQRIGADEAPSVAAFFVGHNAAFYAQRMHSTDCLLHDAEKLRTEWATGRKVHQTEARMNDQTASNPFLQILEERRLEASK